MRKPRSSEMAWAGLAAGVAVYEALAPEGELMTNQAHRWIESDNRAVRAATIGTIGITALHLLDILPPKVDPYHWIGKAAVAIRSYTYSTK